MTKRILAPAAAAFLFAAGCMESPVAPVDDPSGSESTAMATKTEKVDLCHLSEDEPGVASLISVPLGRPSESHLAHGDVYPGDPVPGMPGYTFDSNCAAAGNSPPVCEYEIAEDGSSITFYGHDEDGTIETLALSRDGADEAIIDGLHTSDVTVTFNKSSGVEEARAFAAFIDDDWARTDCSVGLIPF
jgi:hypothetical protein